MDSPNYALTRRLDAAACVASSSRNTLREMARKAALMEAHEYYRTVMAQARAERARRDAVLSQARRA